MKISELIEQLEYVLERDGNLPVVVLSEALFPEYKDSTGVLVSLSESVKMERLEDLVVEIWGR